ncbi:MAG: apoptotic protease-activating factor, partial [Moorea sp. SIO2C4]|nr:apoptotic protease-activating factor [Moorena sp. SIO2C4]
LEVAKAITDEYNRAYALSGLAPYLPERLLREALEVAQAITGEYNRAKALSGLAPQLPRILPEALDAARTITNPRDRAYALSGLAPQLPRILPEALDAARATNPRDRADALIGLARHWPEILPEALEAAAAITDEYYRADALMAIEPHCPESLLPEALETAQAIQSEYHRARVFSGLIENPGLSLQEDVSLWQEFLHTLACSDRQRFLGNLVDLSPTIISLGGKEALAAIVEAIKDVSRWWP